MRKLYISQIGNDLTGLMMNDVYNELKHLDYRKQLTIINNTHEIVELDSRFSLDVILRVASGLYIKKLHSLLQEAFPHLFIPENIILIDGLPLYELVHLIHAVNNIEEVDLDDVNLYAMTFIPFNNTDDILSKLYESKILTWFDQVINVYNPDNKNVLIKGDNVMNINSKVLENDDAHNIKI